ncbi:MAG: N(G),N(G)-dimethylarginine dimethylaminohydrolase [Thermoleophilia bacterium]
MNHRFTRAIVRPPAPTFADGCSTADLGAPDVALALQQHQAYCDALERAGCELTVLPALHAYPDSTFVEDAALILSDRGAILTRPGAQSRAGEVAAIRATITEFFPDVAEIVAPGTLDAGDVCEAATHVFIGLSRRTNEEGARQLAAWLANHGYTSSTVDVRGIPEILHLKSGMCCLGGNRLTAISALADHPAFADYEVISVDEEEAYAANCLQVNDVVLVPAGFPKIAAKLRNKGYTLEVIAMSEYRKMDGALTCLSLRF